MMISTSAGETQVTDVGYEAMEGDARSVICEAVDRHHAEVLVVGCHGYSKWKRSSSLISCSSMRFNFVLLEVVG